MCFRVCVWGGGVGRGVQYFIRILLLPKNKLFYSQGGKNKYFFAKIIFIPSEKRISTKT